MHFLTRFKRSTLSEISAFFITLTPLILLAGFVTAIAYYLFFLCAPYVWSFNSRLPIMEYMPMVRGIVQSPRNGIQIYVLYGLTHAIVGVCFLLYYLFHKISSISIKRGLLFMFAIVSLFFFWKVGFTPPMAAFSSSIIRDIPRIAFIASVLGITGVLSLFITRSRFLSIILAILFFPICMVASGGASTVDYNFILFPALRIFHGFALNQTSFQYDHLLSLLAALWMKLGFSFYAFSLVGQISVYAFFVGLYLFASRFFTHKCYALYLVLSAVIVRIYGNLADIIQCFQVTPLRLDWWLLVLMAIFYKKASHWITGLTLGFLLIFHHAFGVIYTLAYVGSVLFLFAMDVVSKTESLKPVLRHYVALYARNIVLIGLSFLIYRLFFAFGESSSSGYRQHGLGFIPVTEQSFYWYVPVLLSLVFIMNWRNRAFLSERYFQVGLLSVFLAIGNSLYFFGRSHENNIINISSLLLFCLFLLLDLIHGEGERVMSSRSSKWALPVLAVILIAGIGWVYSARGAERAGKQIANLRAHFWYDPDAQLRIHRDVVLATKLTRSDKQVTFLSFEDGYYYYEGGYVPQDPYCAASANYALVEPFKGFLGRALKNGHDLVMPLVGYNNIAFGEVLATLPARYVKVDPEMVVVSNHPLD